MTAAAAGACDHDGRPRGLGAVMARHLAKRRRPDQRMVGEMDQGGLSDAADGAHAKFERGELATRPIAILDDRDARVGGDYQTDALRPSADYDNQARHG